MSADGDPREAMLKAAVACKHEDYERADDALCEALSRVRRLQSNGGSDE